MFRGFSPNKEKHVTDEGKLEPPSCISVYLLYLSAILNISSSLIYVLFPVFFPCVLTFAVRSLCWLYFFFQHFCKLYFLIKLLSCTDFLYYSAVLPVSVV